MKIICVHYTERQIKCLTSDEKCNCDLGLKCPKEFQCPQYKTDTTQKRKEKFTCFDYKLLI